MFFFHFASSVVKVCAGFGVARSPLGVSALNERISRYNLVVIITHHAVSLNLGVSLVNDAEIREHPFECLLEGIVIEFTNTIHRIPVAIDDVVDSTLCSEEFVDHCVPPCGGGVRCSPSKYT
jgi:hypothetical protein